MLALARRSLFAALALLAACLAASTSAAAQAKTRAQILADVQTWFPVNAPNKSISPLTVQFALNEIVNSVLFATQANTGGYVSKFRNGTFDVWQRGISALSTVTGATGAYTADGWQVQQTGAAFTCAQSTGTAGTLYSLQCVGGTSNTDTVFLQSIESSIAAPLSGSTVTAQFQYKQDTGSSVTPKISTCFASVKDAFATCTSDLASTSLTSCATATWCTESYTLSASVSASNGYRISFDCNTALTSSQHCWITAADVRVTPSVPTGVNAAPPPPELRPIVTEMALCQRYFATNYPNGTTPADGVTTVGGNWTGFGTLTTNIAANLTWFPVQMRATPTMTYYRAVGSGTAVWNWYNAGTFTAASAVATTGISNSIGFGVNLTVTGVVVGTAYLVNGGWTASAEL